MSRRYLYTNSPLVRAERRRPRCSSADVAVERYQRQYSLMSRFGLQSNVIIAASYTNRDANGAALSKALVYPALRQVVQQYPELGMIYFWRLSEKKTSQHRCWSGFLRQINLDDHVKFMEIPEDEERQVGLATIIER